MKFKSMPSLKAPTSCLAPSKLALIFVTAVTSLLSGPQAHAAPKLWTGASTPSPGNGNWANGNNWSPGGAPASGDTLTFAGSVNTATVQNISDLFAVGGLAFTNSNLTVTNAFSIAGTPVAPSLTPSKITLGGNITTTASTTTITDALSIDIILSGTRTVTTGTGHNMTLSGVISGTNFGIIKDGGGTLTLSGASANTYSGLTTVSAGTLELNKTANIAAIANGGLTINTGGTVKYVATADQIGNQSAVTVAGGTLDMNNQKDIVGRLIYQSGTISNVNGPLQLNSNNIATLSMRDTTIGFGVTLGSISPGVGVTFDATNNGTATINGAFNLNGTATTGLNRTFTINNGSAANDMVINGKINDSISTDIIKAGSGTLVFTNDNTYRGATAVDSGTLLLNNTTGSGTGAGAVTVASNAALGGDGTVGGSATFKDGSIFAWNLSVTTPANTGSATVADTFAVTGTLNDGDLAGGSVFKILLAGNQTFGDNFWSVGHSWSNVLTSGNVVPVALETLFTSFSYENVAGTISPTGYGSFSLSGSTLNWQAVPEPSTAMAGLLLTAGLLRRRRK